MRSHLSLIIFSSFLILLSRPAFPISDRQAILLGRQAHLQMMHKYGEWNNPEAQARVDRIGRQLTRFSNRPEIAYHFYLLNSDIYNAFATPDGSIHVSKGLLNGFTDDNELQFVLGHEMTHVEKRHGKSQIEKSMQTQLAGNLLLILLHERGTAARYGMGAAQTWLNMKYSRDHETEADEGGMRLLQRAGLDPEVGPKALEHLFQISKSHPGLLTQYFGSHPMPDERVQHAKTYAASLKALAPTPSPSNPGHLN